MQQQCIRRIRAEQHVNRIRSAILKAYLNRKVNIYNINEKLITMALDLDNKTRVTCVVVCLQFLKNSRRCTTRHKCNYKRPLLWSSFKHTSYCIRTVIKPLQSPFGKNRWWSQSPLRKDDSGNNERY